MGKLRTWLGSITAVWLLTAPVTAPVSAEVQLRHVPLQLPGAPAAILPADLDADGHLDLIVAVAYTRWDAIGITESSEIDEVQGLVEVMTVVPALVDRRELWWFRGDGDGGYEVAGPPLALGLDVLSLIAGPSAAPVLALTDAGVSLVRLAREPLAANSPVGDPGGDPAAALRLEPWIDDPPVLAGTATFLGDLDLAHDLDGDGELDLLLPAGDGLAIYLAAAGLPATAAASRAPLPADEASSHRRPTRHYPLPRVEDFTGDGLPDVLLLHHARGWSRFWALVNRGGGRLAPATGPLGEPGPPGESSDTEEDPPEVVFFGDLDGDGVGEYASEEDLSSDEDLGIRAEMAQAKVPPFRYRLHRSAEDLGRLPQPYLSFPVRGYSAGQGDGDGPQLPGGFQDLDGDGRRDLVTLTLDFSLLQAVRVLATRSISIGLDFHVWCQAADGTFSEVEGLDLSGKFKLRLDDLKLGRLPQMGGDFNGDGRADFVQLGRGRTVTLHLGRPGCRFPTSPDARLRLEEEPRDLGLVRVTDLDGDGRSDLLIVQPERREQRGESPRSRLDLYLSADR